MKAYIAGGVAALSLLACSWSAGTHLTQGRLADSSYIASTADFRFIFARPKSTALAAAASDVMMPVRTDTPDADPNFTVCAEPSPDVAKAISDAIKESAEATASGLKALGNSGASVTLDQGVSQTQNTSLAQLGGRLATTQLMRDGVYRLCEGYANGAISRAEYGFALSRYGDTMVSLLSIEAISGLSDNPSVTETKSTASIPDAASGVSAPIEASAPAAAPTPKKGRVGMPQVRVAALAQAGQKPGAAAVAAPAVPASGSASPGTDKDPKMTEAKAIVDIQANYLRQSVYAPAIVLCVNALGSDIRAADSANLNKLEAACKDLLIQYAISTNRMLQNAAAGDGQRNGQ